MQLRFLLFAITILWFSQCLRANIKCPIGYIFNPTINNSKLEEIRLHVGNRYCNDSLCSTITGAFKADEENYLNAEYNICSSKLNCENVENLFINNNTHQPINTTGNFENTLLMFSMYLRETSENLELPQTEYENEQSIFQNVERILEKLKGPVDVKCCDTDLCNGDADIKFKRSGNTEHKTQENDNSTKPKEANFNKPKEANFNKPKGEDLNKPKEGDLNRQTNGNSNESVKTKYSIKLIVSIIFLSLFLMIR